MCAWVVASASELRKEHRIEAEANEIQTGGSEVSCYQVTAAVWKLRSPKNL
jgi:hypothetical protein